MLKCRVPDWVSQAPHPPHGFFEDFDHLVTADRWTSILTDSGGATVLDKVGGVVELDASNGGASDNDEAYIHTTAELFLFAASKPLIWEAFVQFTEANTDDANIVAGLMSAPAANHLQDNGAGPAASYSGVVFFKEDGQTVWSVENSIGGTQKTTQLTAANSLDKTAKTAGGASFQKLTCEWYPYSSSEGDFVFKIDDVLVAKHTSQSFSSATEMGFILGVKNGDTNEEKLQADYCFCYQER